MPDQAIHLMAGSFRITRRAAILVSVVAALAIVGIDRGVSGKARNDNAVKIRFVDSGAAAKSAAINDRAAQLASATFKSNSQPVELLHETSDITPAKPVISAIKGRRVVYMEVTAYCPCKKCCGPGAMGLTASGRKVSYNGGRFVAADPGLSFGTQLCIPGYNGGRAVEVTDRGGAIKGNKLDVFFPTHEQATNWGRRIVPVTFVR